MAQQFDYDVVVIGSGFGGSVAALRLTEKGYSVGVLEAGRRFADDELPKTNWQVRKFFWAPRLGCTGIQRIHMLPDVLVLAGAGVGGGSLVYANTLYEPKSDAFYRDPHWAHISDWKAELAPFYNQAKRMLGVVTNPTMTRSDKVLLDVAQQMGVADTFGMTPVGVFFGPDNTKAPGVEVDDPFFGGAGPRRRGCLEVGECMTGCRHNAKNTLVKNYLYLAERAGAEIHPLTTVVNVRPQDGGYAVDTVRTGAWRRSKHTKSFTAEQVVFAAGTWGTQQLLHRMKATGTLPQVSDRLGELTRTNSEALCTASVKLRDRKGADFTQGVAITSSIHPDDKTHIEPVRYGKGSNSMALLTTVMTDGGGRIPRWVKWLGQVVRHPGQAASLYVGLRDWSQRTVIALVMQTEDNSLTLFPKRTRLGRFKLSSRQGHGVPNPTWIPSANETVRRLAREIDGAPYSSVGEILDIPMTAHFLGGCVIGDSPERGVIDPYHRMFGHPGLHVFDGSAISANLGVNPSLTITAQAERATAFWPNRGDVDTRPAIGDAYRRIRPVEPLKPVVPSGAPAALRLG
ncbi:GMC oxidoreductase [Mycobacterium vicinigordonae]|uniref:Cholesterol oxidase n=1 Tax=Mycobacterium vicinigordonae TaxID=1719132 RepID=A0A7D6E2T9_9MYCO|nr:GMC family oxidoreductase [Mycobacterium vicinigordonae]QLL07546.1 GMC family oxidoreductase [Mycobacterium vicinigordonae]